MNQTNTNEVFMFLWVCCHSEGGVILKTLFCLRDFSPVFYVFICG